MTAIEFDLIVSSDSHVIEPPDLWTSRLPADLQARAPRVVSEETGDYWFVDGHRSNSFAGGAQPGQRFDDASALRSAARWSEVRPGAYDPDAHLDENLADGIVASVLYPTEGLLLFGVADPALLQPICRVYNEWLAEFCAFDPQRLRGVAMVAVDDVGWAVEEVGRAVDLGLAGVMIPVAPTPGDSYADERYDPFWDAVSTARLPVSLHIGTNRGGLAAPGQFRSVSPVAVANADIWVRNSLGELILGGVFDRHPQLRVGSVEHELAWIPLFLDRLDYTYTQRARRPGWQQLAQGAVPSDYFRRHVFTSFQEDARGVSDRDVIGVGGMMFGSDYPHTESTFPRSRAVLGGLLAVVDEATAQAIAWGNCAELYGLDTAALRAAVGEAPSAKVAGDRDSHDEAT